MTEPAPTAALVDELRAIARAFTGDESETRSVLETMADDVRRALDEPLTIFPVMHHSPASAVHMVRFLRRRQPKLVFVEMCEDLIGQVDSLRDCTLPVAMHAFAAEAVGFPADWAPLSVVAPLTALSAEYQAIAYALCTEGVQLVFVDRSVDAVYRWMDPEDNPLTPVTDDDAPDTEADDDTRRLHGEAVGVEVGSLRPSFREFHDVLLQNARMSHFAEWASLYIEEPTINADTHTYREILAMVGSLFRRLGSTPHDREEIRRRDRHMWTRIKQTLAATKIAATDAVFICGAAHTVADDCPEWGTATPALWDDPELSTPSGTPWKYGIIPSSYGAIERQFGHPRGMVTLAESVWRKALSHWDIAPYGLEPSKPTKAAKDEKEGKPAKPRAKAQRRAPAPEQLGLRAVLRDPPALTEADEAELIGWCTRVVANARDHHYLASTADAIAIYETSILLARMRSRRRPSPFDFIDAAQTCLEKGRPPGRRDIRAICNAMLGGDRIGQVGYASLPPLVQDVYDRLAPCGITATTARVVRVLMDFDARPELRVCSRLLWRLHWLLPDTRVARPIMGKLELGETPRQESWDVRLHGPEQRAVIELAFEGVSVEHVLEQRLANAAFKDGSRTLDALEAAESCLLLLDRSRLAETLGERAVVLLAAERGPDDAAEIFDRARRLVHYFRGQAEGVPVWLSRFVATGYATYSTLLPFAFGDRGTSPAQLGAMLSFVFTLESLALAMGCERSQLVIAVEQAQAQAADPEKLGLLWATQWLVQSRDEADVRAAFEAVLAHPLGRRSFPGYLAGFLRALSFAPRAAVLAVELLGRAFARLPDAVLLPWMPGLLIALREHAIDAVPALMKELARNLPTPGGVAQWSPPWMTEGAPAETNVSTTSSAQSSTERAAHALLRGFPDTTDAWACAFGLTPQWSAPREPANASSTASASNAAARTLVATHDETMQAWARVLAR